MKYRTDCIDRATANPNLVKTLSPIGVTLWHTAGRYSAIDWSEDKNEKMSKLDAYVWPKYDKKTNISNRIQIMLTYYSNKCKKL